MICPVFGNLGRIEAPAPHFQRGRILTEELLFFCIGLLVPLAHPPAPGMKQRIIIPVYPRIGQTMVRPIRFGSVMTASSGTSIHSILPLLFGIRTR